MCAEWNTGWLAHWLERLDHAFYRSRAAAAPELDLKPTEYWRRQFYATFEDDRSAGDIEDLLGRPRTAPRGKAMFRRLDRLASQLRSSLEAAGFSAADVKLFLAHPGLGDGCDMPVLE